MSSTGFKLYLATKRREQTVINYIQYIKRFDRDVPDYDVEAFKIYFSNLLEKGLKPISINRMIVALHIYGKYLKTDKFESIHLLREERPEKPIFSQEELITFLQHSNGSKWDLFFKIMAYSGMRPGEVRCLTRSQIDLGRKIFLADGKTGKRYVPIAQILLHDLTAYLKDLDGEYLFPGTSKPFTSRERYTQVFQERLKMMGIQRKGLSAHSLRHSFITRMLDEDINLYKIQKIVGHKRSETTEVYTHFTTKDITKAMTRDPLSRSSLRYDERFKLFREGVRKLLEDYSLSVEEEKEMLERLLNLP